MLGGQSVPRQGSMLHRGPTGCTATWQAGEQGWQEMALPVWKYARCGAVGVAYGGGAL